MKHTEVLSQLHALGYRKEKDYPSGACLFTRSHSRNLFHYILLVPLDKARDCWCYSYLDKTPDFP